MIVMFQGLRCFFGPIQQTCFISFEAVEPNVHEDHEGDNPDDLEAVSLLQFYLQKSLYTVEVNFPGYHCFFLRFILSEDNGEDLLV